MPLAALLESSIFCNYIQFKNSNINFSFYIINKGMHGGIPENLNSFEEIIDIPRPVLPL